MACMMDVLTGLLGVIFLFRHILDLAEGEVRVNGIQITHRSYSKTNLTD